MDSSIRLQPIRSNCVSVTSHCETHLRLRWWLHLLSNQVNSRQSRKTQQMSQFSPNSPNSKHSQQETTHSTRPSWNQYVSSHQPNHVSPSAICCTHAAQLEIHQSKTMAVLCLSLTHRAHNQLDTLIEMHHCQCKCACLVSKEQQSRLDQTRKHGIFLTS